MAFVATAAMVGGGSALLGGALIGAGVGGLYSAITGDGNILNSMLTGGLIGGAAGGIGAAVAPNAAVASASPFYTAAPTATAVKTVLPASQAATAGGSMGGISAGGAFTPTAGSAAKFTLPTVSQGISGAKMLGYGLAGTSAMQLLDGRKGGIPVGGTAYPGDIRPYEFAARQPSTADGSMFPTTQYDMAGNPMLDTSERTYFDQSLTPLQAYKAGTANPNPVMAAQGGLMAAYPMDKYGPMTPNTETYMNYMAEGGEVGMDEKRRKIIMKNIKGTSTKQLENILGSMNQQEFLRKNMPNYAAAMAPSISGMVEGAQYGDRMAKSYGGQPRDINVMPTTIDPQSGMYGGIASIGRQIDPQTRVNAMANIQRTPYDRNAMESVRRLGVGVDRKLGKDTNLSAFYEQDPMGRDKMGGVRLSQRFAKGGMSDLGGYSDGGRMLKGPGDGMSDNIPGVIGGKQPARLADGEFVIPADVVSHLGNGSTDAGAKRLYAMMDTVRKARTGNKKQGKQIKAEKYLPA